MIVCIVDRVCKHCHQHASAVVIVNCYAVAYWHALVRIS